MATIILDFDSTFIPLESYAALDIPDAIRKQLEDLSSDAMSGRMSFQEAFARRIAIYAPNLAELRKVGQQFSTKPTHGMPEIVKQMKKANKVIVVSGGFKDLILEAVVPNGISAEDVYAVEVEWDTNGQFRSLIPNGFAISKPEGINRLQQQWSHPIIAVGDGTTDAALKTHGIADYFIAYIEHVKRWEAIKQADYVVDCAAHLLLHLYTILRG